MPVLRRALVIVLVLAAGLPAHAELAFPALTGRVVDGADLLSAGQERELTDRLAALEAETTDQLVVVTLPSLQGVEIEEFGYQLGRHWGIGQAGKDNGVLLIVAPNERKVRIEVGYGLEGTLTDALARVIIDTAILPRFRANDMAGGIVAGANDIAAVLTGEGAEVAERVAARPNPSDDIFPVIFLIIFVIVFLIVLFSIMRAGGGSGSGAGWSGSSSGGSWSSSGGGFSGGGGSFGGGGSSGSW